MRNAEAAHPLPLRVRHWGLGPLFLHVYSISRSFSKDGFDPASDISMVSFLEPVERASVEVMNIP